MSQIKHQKHIKDIRNIFLRFYKTQMKTTRTRKQKIWHLPATKPNQLRQPSKTHRNETYEHSNTNASFQGKANKNKNSNTHTTYL